MATNKSEKKTKPKAGSPKPQEQEKHPAEWRDDLNPEQMEGQNIGPSSKRNDSGARTAADIDILAAVWMSLRATSCRRFRSLRLGQN